MSSAAVYGPAQPAAPAVSEARSAWADGLLPGLCYLLAAAAVFVPGLLSPPDWTGTEGRRVQIALEMVHSGDWLVPTLGFEPNLSKPPLHYWIVGWLAARFEPAIWLLRLPGALAFALLAWLAHALFRRSHGTGAAWCAGLGVLAAPLVMALVPRAEIDPIFAALSAASILLLARGAAFGTLLPLVAGGVVAGLAFLVKGPPYLMLFAGTAAVWLRRRRGRRLLLALLLTAALPAAYYVALESALAGDTSLVDVAVTESVGRIGTFTWQHALDTPMHFVRAFLASLPFGLFLFYEYRGARPARPDDAESFVRMVAAAAFSTVLVLTFFPTRPARYLLPAVPLFFAAVSPSVASFARRGMLTPGMRRGLAGLALVAALALCAHAWLPPPFGARTALGFAFLAALPLWVDRACRAVAAMLLLPVVAAWTFAAPLAEHRALYREPFAAAGPALQRALAARGAHDLASLLHIPSPLLLHAGILPPGDEFARRDPAAPWLLMEEGARPPAVWAHLARAALPPPGYEARVRLQLPKVAVLLLERRG
ncbi:MAG TPA: glycosyltransferase family 39 protein [Planctomycetota bacterium]|nr:glycosyltransferase family 39 protein [Planctomycetota bacterium]